jgi:hypothetical protein
MTAELTKAEATILDTVRRDGPTVFDGRKAKPIAHLEALGLVTVNLLNPPLAEFVRARVVIDADTGLARPERTP